MPWVRAEVYRIACQLVREKQTAEDIAQEAMLLYLEKENTLPPGKDVRRGFLVKALRNFSWRTRKSWWQEWDPSEHEALVECLPPSDGRLQLKEARHELRQAIESLPEDELKVIVHLYASDLKVKDTAQLLGVTDRTIQNRRDSALERLRQKLQSKFGGSWASALILLMPSEVLRQETLVSQGLLSGKAIKVYGAAGLLVVTLVGSDQVRKSLGPGRASPAAQPSQGRDEQPSTVAALDQGGREPIAQEDGADEEPGLSPEAAGPSLEDPVEAILGHEITGVISIAGFAPDELVVDLFDVVPDVDSEQEQRGIQVRADGSYRVFIPHHKQVIRGACSYYLSVRPKDGLMTHCRPVLRTRVDLDGVTSESVLNLTVEGFASGVIRFAEMAPGGSVKLRIAEGDGALPEQWVFMANARCKEGEAHFLWVPAMGTGSVRLMEKEYSESTGDVMEYTRAERQLQDGEVFEWVVK